MRGKAVNRSLFVFNSILDRYKTQEIRDIIIHEDPFMLMYNYSPDILLPRWM